MKLSGGAVCEGPPFPSAPACEGPLAPSFVAALPRPVRDPSSRPPRL